MRNGGKYGTYWAGRGAIGGVLADQWKDVFYCNSINTDTLMVKGERRVGQRSSNTKATNNIITNGSKIIVSTGQCMIIVDDDEVVEVCAEEGKFSYDTSSQPSIFSGDFGKSVVDTFKEMGKSFTFGGDTDTDQRIYYVNTKAIVGNNFGTTDAIVFHIVDSRSGIDDEVYIRCHGTYSFRIIARERG